MSDALIRQLTQLAMSAIVLAFAAYAGWSVGGMHYPALPALLN